MDFDVAPLIGVLVAPHLSKEPLGGDRPACFSDQGSQDLELRRGKIRLLSVYEEGAGSKSDAQEVVLIGWRLFQGRGEAAPSKKSLNTRQELLYLERFGEVVIGPHGEAPELVLDSVPGAEYQEGHVSRPSEAPTHFPAVGGWESHLQNDEVGPILDGRPDGGGDISSHQNLVATSYEGQAKEIQQLSIGVDDKDPGSSFQLTPLRGSGNGKGEAT